MDNPVPETPPPPIAPPAERPINPSPPVEPQVGFPKPVVIESSAPLETLAPSSDHTSILPGSEKPKSKTNLLMIVAIVLLLLAIGVLGFFIFQNIQKRETPAEPTPTPTPTATPTPTVDPTAGWETYTNSKYNYLLMFPNDWSVKENAGPDISGNQAEYIVFYSPTKAYALTFGIRKSGENIKIVGRSGVSAGEFVAGQSVKLGMISIPTKNLIYNEKVKAVFYQPSQGFSKIDNFEIYADFDRITLDDYDSRDIKNLPELSIANQILSTFEFTSQTPTSSPSAIPTVTP